MWVRMLGKSREIKRRENKYFSLMICSCRKCNLPMNPHVRLLVGLSNPARAAPVCHNCLKKEGMLHCLASIGALVFLHILSYCRHGTWPANWPQDPLLLHPGGLQNVQRAVTKQHNCHTTNNIHNTLCNAKPNIIGLFPNQIIQQKVQQEDTQYTLLPNWTIYIVQLAQCVSWLTNG